MFTILLISSILISIVKSGIIEAYGPKPIELSINNQGKISSYIFKFYFKTDTIDLDTLQITFPKAQYTLPQGACSTLKIFLLPRVGKTGETQLTCSVKDQTLTAILPEIKASSVAFDQFRIEGITNPAEGGTGYFAVESRRANINVLDYNHMFSHVGMTEAPKVMTGVSSSFNTNKVNEISILTIGFTTLGKIEFDGYLIFKFSILTFLPNMTCTSTISASISCNLDNPKQIRLQNIKTELPPSVQTIVISNVQNPDFSGVPGDFTIQNWEKGTNTIIDEITNFNLPSINPGVLKSDSASMFISNFKEFFELSSSYKLTNADEILYDFYFTSTNSVNDNGKIELTFPVAPKVSTTCKCSMGLQDISESLQVTCAIAGSKMTLTNFLSFPKNTIIGITFTVVNPATISGNVLVETFKFLNPGYALVDSYNGAFPISILATITKWTKLILNPVGGASNNKVRASNVGITATVQVASAGAIGDKILITFSIPFSFASTPTCSFTLNGGGNGQSGLCTLSGKTVTITTSAIVPTGVDHTIQINNLNMADKAGRFPIEFEYQNSAGTTLLHETSYYLVTPADLVLTIEQITRDQLRPSIFLFGFVAPEKFPNGVHKTSFTSTTLYMKIDFETKDAGSCNQFKTDLGTGKVTGANVYCYGNSDLYSLIQVLN